METPKTLLDIQQYIDQHYVVQASGHTDGRIDSALKEEDLVNELLANGFEGRITKSTEGRSWYDIWLVKEGLPVDIKFADMTTSSASNGANYKSLIFTLSGEIVKMQMGNQLRWLINRKEDGLLNLDKDYWYLGVDKTTSKSKIVSVRTIISPNINPNNLPIQIKWGVQTALPSLTPRSDEEIYAEIITPGSLAYAKSKVPINLLELSDHMITKGDK